MSKNYSISKCPRCGKSHNDLEFRSLSKSTPNGYTHYAFCPETNEPILLSSINYDRADEVLRGYGDCKYLGDSVYALHNGFNIALAVIEDNEIFDIVYLEPKSKKEFVKYLKEIDKKHE
jgi:hypothetical protein